MTLCVALILAAASCGHKEKDTASAIPEINVAEATVSPVVLQDSFPGVLRAHDKADVVGEVSGRLLTQNFTSGSYVTKGQVLFTIESVTYRDAVEQARASLATAESQRDFYSSQTAAMKKAYDLQAVSKMELMQSQASLRQAEASISSARAQLENAGTKLSKCTVRAPISGYITLNEVSVGNYINGDGAPQKLAEIYDNSVFDAVFSISDSRYSMLLGSDKGPGAAAYREIPLSFRAPLAHAYTADLYYVAPTVSSSTGTMQLVGSVRNEGNELRDGMYVTVSLPYGMDQHAVIVKDAAISTDQLGKYMYVVNDSNRVVYTPVTLGPLYRDSLRVIEKGISEGQRYVTQALLTVRNGMQIKPRLTR